MRQGGAAAAGENARASWRVDFGSPTIQAILVILAFSLWRLVAAAVVGLGIDEAYTISVSKELRLSYFDHPPIQYWISHFTAWALGPGRIDRLPFVALFAATSWLMFVVTRRLFSAKAGVWACLALNLSGFLSVAAGGWVAPDGPLDLCLMAATLILVDGWIGQETPRALSPGAWLMIGVCAGVAGLSKYQAALYCAGLALFLVATPARRAELRRPWPYLAAVLTVALLSPILVWNAQHDWASIAFQAGRGAPNRGFNPWGPLVSIGAQAGVLLPWIFVPLSAQFVRAVRAGPADERRWLLLTLALPTIAVFTFAPLFGTQGLPHWSMCGWMMLFPLVGDQMARSAETRSWPKIWAASGLGFLVAVTVLLGVDANTGFLGPVAHRLFGLADPTVEAMDWTAVRPELARRGLLGKPGTFVAAIKWTQAGKLDMAVGDVMPVVVLSHDPREYAYRSDPKTWVGHDALIIGRADVMKKRLPELTGYFRSTTRLAPIRLGRSGHDEVDLEVISATGMLRPYPWLPELPFSDPL